MGDILKQLPLDLNKTEDAFSKGAPQSRMPVIHGTRLRIRSVVVILLQQGSVVFPVYLQHEAFQLAAAVQSGLVKAFQHRATSPS